MSMFGHYAAARAILAVTEPPAHLTSTTRREGGGWDAVCVCGWDMPGWFTRGSAWRACRAHIRQEKHR